MTAGERSGGTGGDASEASPVLAAALPAAVPASTSAPPKRRAVLLVPGWGMQKRNVRRDWLVGSLELNDPMPVEKAVDGAIPGETYRRLVPKASATEQGQPIVDIYEAHWSDLATAEDQASPIRRFGQATVLIFYWFFSSWWLRVLVQAFELSGDSLRQIRQAFVLLLSIVVAGVVMLAWYATVLVALVRSGIPGLTQPDAPPAGAGEGGTQPGSAAEDSDATLSSDEAQGVLLERLFSLLPDSVGTSLGQIDMLAGTELFSLLALTLAAFNVAGFIAIPRFVRAYLVSGTDSALHMEVHQRVQDALDHIYDYRAEGETRPFYDEVVVVGHSLGAAISVEALADWGNANVARRTVLITWGGALRVLSARSPKRVAKMVRKACDGAVPRWIDVYSSADWMSAELPAHTEAYPKSTLKPEFPVAWWQGYSSGAHNQYYYNRQTLAMLLMPEISVEGLPD